MELVIVKNDVVAELRTQRYFNEQEITRLVGTELIPHRDRVLQVAELTRQNANIIEALKLLEQYFPSVPVQQPAPTPAPAPAPANADTPQA
jgi:hypothetical protein